MQHKSPHRLSQNTRRERRHRTTATPKRRDDTQPTDLSLATDVLTEDDSGTGVDGSEEQTDDAESDCVTNHVGDAPHDELEGGGSDDGAVDEDFLSDLVGGVREEESSYGYAGPESRCDL